MCRLCIGGWPISKNCACQKNAAPTFPHNSSESSHPLFTDPVGVRAKTGRFKSRVSPIVVAAWYVIKYSTSGARIPCPDSNPCGHCFVGYLVLGTLYVQNMCGRSPGHARCTVIIAAELDFVFSTNTHQLSLHAHC